MGTNPYLNADSLRVARESGRLSEILARVGPAAASAAAMAITGDAPFAWTQGSESVYLAGAAGHAARVGVALAGAMALLAYGEGVRGPDRGLADLHPVLVAPYTAARRSATTRASWAWLGGALPLLLPLHHRPDALAAGAALVVGGWAAGQACGLALALAAPSLGASPTLAPLLDAVRGPNPRPQAALIWAPGVALAAAGLAVVAGAYGMAAGGWGLAALVLPWVVAVAARRVRPSARDLCVIPAVLADVDASWAAVDAADDGQRVYMEGPVRWLPAPMRPEVLRHLRHGWREHRAFLNGAWLLVAVCVVAALSGEWLALPLLVATAAALGALGPRMAAHDPPWLDLALPRRGVARARALALAGWIGAALLLPTGALLARGHAPAALLVVGLGGVLAAAGGWMAPWPYAAASLGAVAVSLGWLGLPS